MKLLLDTNIISYWHSGHPKFKVPLETYFRKTRKTNKNVGLFVSVITVQELACWSKPAGGWEAIRQFLRVWFPPPLTFCELCACKAADMQVRAGPQGKATEGERAEWHHDAAIVGTAAQHGLDVIVTADNAFFKRYGQFFEKIVHIAPVGS